MTSPALAGPPPSTLLRLRPYVEVLREARPRPDLVDGLIHPVFTTITGQPYAGKTWFVLHLVRAVVTGTPFCGREVTGRTHVVAHVPIDPGAADEDSHRASTLDIPEDRLLIVDRCRDTWRSEELAAAQARHWVERGVTCAIFDNLLGLLPAGADVNSAAHVRPTLDALAAVAEQGIAVVLVHHSAKPGPQGHAARGPMGSQNISAVTRRTITLTTSGQHVEVDVKSNSGAAERFHLVLRGAECRLPTEEERPSSRGRKARDHDRFAEEAAAVLAQATPEQRQSAAALGRILHDLGYSSSVEGGRKKVDKWLKVGRLVKAADGSFQLPEAAA